MKSLWGDLRPLLLHIAAFSLFINLLFLVPAFFTLQVFDRVISTGSHETLLVLMAGTGIALLLLLLLDYIRTRLQNVVGNMIDEQLSPDVVQTIVERAARHPTGRQAEGVKDVASVRAVFSSNGLIALFDAPWVVVYVAVIWLFHPALGIGATLSALIMLALAWLNDRLSRKALEEVQNEGRRASRYVESSMRNAEVLQALGMTRRLLARWRVLQDRVAEMGNSASRKTVAFTAVTKTVRQAIQILMLALGAWLVLTQQASAGVMIATSILLGRAVQPVEQLVGSWRPLIEARAAYRRLVELSKDFAHLEERVTMPRPEGLLTADNVSYRPAGSENMALVAVSFALAPGEALAIVGPSAAGKSTLARLLTGIWAPSSGKVRLDGADLAYWRREDLGPHIGYVPQDVELFDGTVADNIARLEKVDSKAVVAAAQRANAHEMILTLPKGYDTPVGEQGARLSPGQRQRVALARALYGNPQLVILDEPNSNLDGAGEIALAQALSELRSSGVTSVVVTHRPSLIAHVDKILVLANGRVQQFGKASEVMKEMQRQSQVMVARTLRLRPSIETRNHPMSSITFQDTVPSFAMGKTSQDHARRLVRTGVWIVLGAIVPLGLWMGFAPLSMAVVAPAFVKVDLNRRPVQHLEGGTVRQVLVRDGQQVKAGDPVLILGDVRIDADHNRLNYRVQVERATLIRLEAEHSLAEALKIPPDLRNAAREDPRVMQALVKENGLFQAQRHSLESATALMKQQRVRIEQEIVAVKAQIAQAESSLELQRRDLEANRGLIKEGFISSSRISQIEAVVMDYAAKLEERRTELARANQRLIEIDVKIQSMRNDYVRSASDQLKATTQRLPRSSRSSASRSTRQSARWWSRPRAARSSTSSSTRPAPWCGPARRSPKWCRARRS